MPIVESGAIRGLHVAGGKLFCVAGTQLYQISSDLICIPCGTVPGTGRVSMAHNQRGLGHELLVVNGSAGYVHNTETRVFAKVTDEGYPGAFIARYSDQYLIQVEPQGRYWFHGDLADAYSYNTLDQYEAEADPDRIVSLEVSHREVLVFGQQTTEVYVNTGGATGTFERASNTVIEQGCISRFAPCVMDGVVFFIDHLRVPRMMQGYTPQPLRNIAVEQALAECTAAEIAKLYSFKWEGDGFKVWYFTVPGKFTFGYDLASNEFHRRQSPGKETWRITSLAYWNGQWVGGDSLGNLYTLDRDYFYDGREELIRECVSGVLHADQKRVQLNEIELLLSAGGPSCDLADFPEQPEGPSLVVTVGGDFYVGDPVPMEVEAADGTPPYRFTLRDLDGVTVSSEGVFSGAPTTAGEFTATVRVTDANGLWAEVELTDTVIAAVDGWDAAHYTDDTAAITQGGRVLSWGGDPSGAVYGNGRSKKRLTGLAYVSGTIFWTSPGKVGFGIADFTEDFTVDTNWVGLTTESVGVWRDGDAYCNNTSVGTAGTVAADTQVGVEIAVNTTNRKVWVRLSGGAWVGGGDPAAGTTPTATLAGTGSLWVVGSFNANGPAEATIHTSEADTTGTAPAGFTKANFA